MTRHRAPPHARLLVAAPIATGPALLRGWRVTHYGAAGAGARIGRRSRGIDALLARAGVRQGAFVTAWNPLSRRRPRRWNDAALHRLRIASAGRGIRFAEGEGRAIAPPWAEAHLLLFGDARRALVLARRFRQHAVVLLRRGAPARLLVLR
jgi:hypothetical protein